MQPFWAFNNSTLYLTKKTSLPRFSECKKEDSGKIHKPVYAALPTSSPTFWTNPASFLLHFMLNELPVPVEKTLPTEFDWTF
jgi:hypothetical protein